MTILSISSAAQAAGIDRRTLQRSIKSGRLSATVDAIGKRGIDVAELIRVFGPLREMPHGATPRQGTTVPQDAPDTAAVLALVDSLRDLVRQSQEQLRQANDRENRLLAMLEAEQQARRELETKLLPAPKSKKGKREK